MSVASENLSQPTLASLPIDADGLTAEQAAALERYRVRWSAIRRSTKPVDHCASEAAVRLAYHNAGLEGPKRIVWRGGPIGIAHLTGRASQADGPNVKAILIHKVHRRVASRLNRCLLRRVKNAINEPDGVSSAVSHVIRQYTGLGRLPALTLIRLAFLSSARVHDAIARLDFGQAAAGHPELAWLGVYEYLHDICGLKEETAQLRGLWLLAQNVGWILPHEHTCWLTERPSILCNDAKNRLHSANGPALRFPDGWSFYAWKGVQVPHWIIEQPDLITVQAIDIEPNAQIRRCMIEIMTPERFVAMGGAIKVAQCEVGTLWRKRWWGDAWAAVEVVNGTPETDGSSKHYFLQVPAHMDNARQAVAWTYGLAERQYARLALRT